MLSYSKVDLYHVYMLLSGSQFAIFVAKCSIIETLKPKLENPCEFWFKSEIHMLQNKANDLGKTKHPISWLQNMQLPTTGIETCAKQKRPHKQHIMIQDARRVYIYYT